MVVFGILVTGSFGCEFVEASARRVQLIARVSKCFEGRMGVGCDAACEPEDREESDEKRAISASRVHQFYIWADAPM
ncbi:hypothetical protein [Parvularcula mediterranea]|uniref:hypothetical protein n=1 Tax=Parvularcula mediterranea TaxID=2732508 RepID=UPI00156674AB|nr:hypothetical protein [Parvularcula mediterranea]